eukprot:12875489-Alexandrium_andersonii.AAC.1
MNVSVYTSGHGGFRGEDCFGMYWEIGGLTSGELSQELADRLDHPASSCRRNDRPRAHQCILVAP